MILIKRIPILLVFMISLGFIQCKRSGSDMEIIKEKIVALNTGNGITSNGPHKREALRDLEIAAKYILDKGSHLAELDINAPGVENKVSAEFEMIQTLAKAYQTEGQKYYHSEEALREIVKGLRHGEKYIKPGTPRPGNWYYWKIDAPRNLGPALILMQDKLNPDLMKSQLECMRDLMMEGPYNKQGYILTGANGAMMGMNLVYYAVLAGDEKMMETGLDLINMEMSVTNTKSGILEDYSYQFHDQLLYTGGYGAEFTLNAALAIYFTENTRYEIPRNETEIFSKFIVDHSQWVIIGDKYDLAVKGRGVRSTPSVRPTPFLLMSQYPSSYQNEIRKFTGSLIFHKQDSWSLMDAPFADQFQNPADNSLYGFRYFYKNDYGVSRKPGFFVSVKMFSDQNRDYEILTGSNPGGHHRSNGFTYFSRNGNEIWQHTRNLDSAYDWEHLPGTTSRLERLPPNFGNFSKSIFAGGAGSDENGIVSFVLIPAIDDFSAKKSYFMFDKGFVAIGSDISSKQKGPLVSTTISQWGTKDVHTPLILSNGEKIDTTALKGEKGLNWAYCDSVGYMFQDCESVNIRKDKLYTTIYMNHGPNPRKATYAYTVLPACSQQEIIDYQKNSEVQILENSDNIHALKDLKSHATGIIFWKAGSFDMFTVDHPAVLYYVEKNGGMEVTVSNPLYNQDTIQLTLNRKFSKLKLPGEAIATEAGDKLLISLHTANRRMYRIGLDDEQVNQTLREDNLPYESFKILKTENTPSNTFLTVRIPEIAKKIFVCISITGKVICRKNCFHLILPILWHQEFTGTNGIIRVLS